MSSWLGWGALIVIHLHLHRRLILFLWHHWLLDTAAINQCLVDVSTGDQTESVLYLSCYHSRTSRSYILVLTHWPCCSFLFCSLDLCDGGLQLRRPNKVVAQQICEESASSCLLRTCQTLQAVSRPAPCKYKYSFVSHLLLLMLSHGCWYNRYHHHLLLWKHCLLPR